MRKVIVLLLIPLVFLMGACGNQESNKDLSDEKNQGKISYSGSLKHLNGSWTYVLTETDTNSGTFEIYEDGRKVGKENIRYSNFWKVENDVLTLESDINSIEFPEYYKLYNGCFIEISDINGNPIHYKYVAPKGNTFNYEIGGYTFYDNGRVVDSYSSGEYYRENNIIYTNLYSDEYYPLFYIYNDEYIEKASNVLIYTDK